MQLMRAAALALFIIAALALSVTSHAVAAPVVWLVRAVEAPQGQADVATSVAPVEGGAVIAGYTTNVAGNEDALLVRVNGDGDVIWRRQFGGKGEDLFWSVHPDGAGGIVCADTPPAPGRATPTAG